LKGRAAQPLDRTDTRVPHIDGHGFQTLWLIVKAVIDYLLF